MFAVCINLYIHIYFIFDVYIKRGLMGDKINLVNKKTFGKYVAYHRNKTLVPQNRALVHEYLSNGTGKLVREFIEAQPRKNRLPELKQAIRYCNSNNAKLVVPQMAHLSRSLGFINGIDDLKNQMFINLKKPRGAGLKGAEMHVNTLLQAYEDQIELKSENIRKALEKRKKAGHKLGTPDPLAGSKISAPINRALADEFADSVLPKILKIQQYGQTTLDGIAKTLNRKKVATRQGGQWTATSVRNILKRCGKL